MEKHGRELMSSPKLKKSLAPREEEDYSMYQPCIAKNLFFVVNLVCTCLCSVSQVLLTLQN
jgi:hypothetical protein